MNGRYSQLVPGTQCVHQWERNTVGKGSSGCVRELCVLPLATVSSAVRQGSRKGMAGRCSLESASLLGPCRVLLSLEAKLPPGQPKAASISLPKWKAPHFSCYPDLIARQK